MWTGRSQGLWTGLLVVNCSLSNNFKQQHNNYEGGLEWTGVDCEPVDCGLDYGVFNK